MASASSRTRSHIFVSTLVSELRSERSRRSPVAAPPPLPLNFKQLAGARTETRTKSEIMKNQLRVLLTFAVAGAIGGDLIAASRATAQVANPVLNELLQKGVPFGMNFRTLPALTMPDGLNQAGQKQVVQKVLGLKAGKQVNYDEFTA